MSFFGMLVSCQKGLDWEPFEKSFLKKWFIQTHVWIIGVYHRWGIQHKIWGI